MPGVITEVFWCAEYNNGLALPEYDITTGKVNRFAHVDHKNVLRFWWLPITADMCRVFPLVRVNPLLRRFAVDLNGSKGFIARRVAIRLGMGSGAKGLSREVKCYVLGIEGGPRREIYPDGSVVDKKYPIRGETQDALHHG